MREAGASVTTRSSAGNGRGPRFAPGCRLSRAPLARGADGARRPPPGGWPRFPAPVAARRHAVTGTALSLTSAGGPSTGAGDSFTGQDHHQGRACGASVLRTADP
jgi:hypothetical protein